jgi:hypothetical protein
MKASWIAFLLAVSGCAQELPRSSAEYGAFALPDQSGARLIATAGISHAEGIRKALCSDGSRVRVRFDHRQIERKDNNGRQSPAQFDKLAGEVFRVVGATVERAASCFLVGNGWLSEATIYPLRAPEERAGCGDGVEARLAKANGRAVTGCFPLKRFGKEGQIVLAEFARAGKRALASVVVVDREHLWFGDYPAEFRGPGEDLWRVDDGGELSAEGFQIIFVAQRGNRQALGVSWAGTEGRSLTLFLSGKGNGFDRVVEDYWYQMPQ